MSGLTAIAGYDQAVLSLSNLGQSINRSGTLEVSTHSSGDVHLALSLHAEAPGRGRQAWSHDGVTGLVAGDPVNLGVLDWPALHRDLLAGDCRTGALADLSGCFGIVLHDTAARRIWIITDPFAWLPLYLAVDGKRLAVSTSLATFAGVVSRERHFSEAWLSEHLFFNFGLGSSTPVEGVERLPPATVTSFSLDAGTIKQHAYRDRLERAPTLLGNPLSAEAAIDTFSSVVPIYFQGVDTHAFGLSSGLDSRTLLAAAPAAALDRLETFTYGIPGADEPREAEALARELGLRHRIIPLEADFEAALPRLARETVYVSDGLQNVNRAHLLHVYGRLKADGVPFSAITTGISGDHIFRDHIAGFGNVPHMMSPAVAGLLRDGRDSVDWAPYRETVGQRLPGFRDHVEAALDRLEQELGTLGTAAAYLGYLVYEVGPRYFSAEALIANLFSSFRNPYWDPDVLELGFRLREATLGFSESLGKKDKYRETYLQASVVASSPRIGRAAYLDIPIRAYANGRKLLFQLHRTLRRLRGLGTGGAAPPVEDWTRWYQTSMRDEVERHLGTDSRLSSYIEPAFIEKAIRTTDVHWLGKLLTAEYTIRYVENGWRRLDAD